METNKKCQKNAHFFFCNFCDFKCSKLSNYNKHLSTDKHERLTNANKKCQKMPKIEKNICSCGKLYKHLSSLSKHKKLCKIAGDIAPINALVNANTVNIVDDSIIGLFKQQMQENNEMKHFLLEQQKQILEQNKQIIELSKEKKMTIYNTNCNNTINKVSLNIFLNEYCKDALNLDEFIHSLHIQVSDLENTAKLGYVEGISRIFVKGLKELDLYKRPVHCSDSKREVLYVKEEDKWEKDNEDNSKIKNAIQQLTRKNIKQIPLWVDENPCCKNQNSKKNDDYMRLVANCMTGITEEEQQTNINKIVSKVAKEVVIQKEEM